MKRGIREFFRKKQYKIAAFCVAIAVIGAVGVYSFTGGRGSENEPENQTAQADTEEKEKKTTVTAKNEDDTEEKNETKTASSVIKPAEKKKKTTTKVKPEEETEIPQIAKADEEEKEEGKEEKPENTEPEKPEETVETAAEPSNAIELHFDADAGMDWPVSGAVILNYSMDKTVYFTTLNQYKYNPAVIISGNVNEKVKAAASGKILDISTNEETGCTVTMDLGDGYTAIYGQLKEVPYSVGAYVEAGNTIGFINEPTKYYSLEGSNLYFELEKDSVPIDPVEYFAAE